MRQGTPLDASLEVWVEAEAAAVRSGVEDRITVALCLLCGERTGADMVTMLEGGWRRAPDRITALPARGRRPLPTAKERHQAQERGVEASAAWRAAGRPRDPLKVWTAAVAKLPIPGSERYSVYVWSELVGEGLSRDEAFELKERVQRSPEYAKRWVEDFWIWPASQEPMPADPAQRRPAIYRWYRSLGLTVPHPGEDSPERRAWEAWKNERATLRGGRRR